MIHILACDHIPAHDAGPSAAMLSEFIYLARVDSGEKSHSLAKVDSHATPLLAKKAAEGPVSWART